MRCRSVLSTWTITHALFKATRQLIFMVLMWPLKTDSATGAPATGAPPGSPTRRNSLRARCAPGSFRPARSFRPFLLFGVLRILCFLVVPAAFVGGAAFVAWADVLTRVMPSKSQIPLEMSIAQFSGTC